MSRIKFKSAAVVLLLISFLINIILYQNKLDSLQRFKDQDQVLKTKIFELEEDILKQVDEGKIYKAEMESYKFIFDAFDKYGFGRSLGDVLEETYEFEASITYGDNELGIPPSGIIHITDDSFSFNATVKKPPSLANQRVNDLVSRYNLELFRSLYYPSPDDFKIEESLLHLEYDDLEIGDRIQMVPTQRFKDKYGIISDVIEIRVVEENFYSGSDYYPSIPTISTYKHSDWDQVQTYDYHTFEESNIDITITREDYVRNVSYDISDGAIIPNNIDLPLLPSILHIGNNWSNGVITKVVTNLDVDVSTPAGDFNCIEISTFSRYGEGTKDYYSKDVGLVKTFNENYTNELIKIEDYGIN